MPMMSEGHRVSKGYNTFRTLYGTQVETDVFSYKEGVWTHWSRCVNRGHQVFGYLSQGASRGANERSWKIGWGALQYTRWKEHMPVGPRLASPMHNAHPFYSTTHWSSSRVTREVRMGNMKLLFSRRFLETTRLNKHRTIETRHLYRQYIYIYIYI